MNKTLCNILLVAAGAAIGSLTTWKIVETKYAHIAQEEIDSVKDSYKHVMDLQKKEVEAYRKMFGARKAQEEDNEPDNPEEEETENDEDNDYPDDDDRDFTDRERAQVEYYKLSSKYQPGYSDKNSQNEVEYIVGDDTETNDEEEGEEGSEDLVQYVNGPYVISPEQFGDIKEFSSQALDYFADGVLADGWGVKLDIEETIGEDALDHFGDYVDDIVYVRNERTEIDYEVTRDPRTYGEAVRTSQNPYYGHED